MEPIFQAVTDARNLSIQEGKNREREEIIEWLSKQKNKTIKIEDLIKVLKEKK
jgi:hypothetical protein